METPNAPKHHMVIVTMIGKAPDTLKNAAEEQGYRVTLLSDSRELERLLTIEMPNIIALYPESDNSTFNMVVRLIEEANTPLFLSWLIIPKRSKPPHYLSLFDDKHPYVYITYPFSKGEAEVFVRRATQEWLS